MITHSITIAIIVIKNDKNEYGKLYEYFNPASNDVLMVGIKMNRMKE